MRRPLLVADEHVVEVGELRQVPVDPEVGATRVAEDGVDALAAQALEQRLRTGDDIPLLDDDRGGAVG